MLVVTMLVLGLVGMEGVVLRLVRLSRLGSG